MPLIWNTLYRGSCTGLTTLWKPNKIRRWNCVDDRHRRKISGIPRQACKRKREERTNYLVVRAQSVWLPASGKDQYGDYKSKTNIKQIQNIKYIEIFLKDNGRYVKVIWNDKKVPSKS